MPLVAIAFVKFADTWFEAMWGDSVSKPPPRIFITIINACQLVLCLLKLACKSHPYTLSHLCYIWDTLYAVRQTDLPGLEHIAAHLRSKGRNSAGSCTLEEHDV